MSAIKKIIINLHLKKIFLFIIIFYIFLKITDGSEKLFSVINKINFYYLLITVIFVFSHTFLIVYVNMIIFNKFLQKKIDKNYFFYSFIKSQILSYIFSVLGIVYRYNVFKNKITLTKFIYINIFILWFFLFFYLILYSFELLIFGYLFFPVNFYIFIFLIFLSFLIFIFPKFIKIFIFKFITKQKLITNYFLTLICKKKNIYNLYSFISLKLIFFGLLSHLISFFQIFFIFKMLGTPILFTNIILVFVINSLLDQLPIITPKNIGISEIIFGHIAETVGLNFDYGVLFKFFLRFFNLFSLCVLLFLIRFKNKLISIKSLK